jgi:glycosyltransferase involved in cell wall biosynthesis
MPSWPDASRIAGSEIVRVDHSVFSVSDRGSGVAAVVRRLAEAEAQEGVDVHVHAIQPGMQIQGTATHFYPLDPGWPRGFGRSAALRLGLAKAGLSADVLHSHNLWSDGSLHASEAIRGTSCLLVCSPHGALHPASLAVSPIRKSACWVLAQRAVLSRADLLHATSLEEAEYIREAGLRNPIVVAPPGVDLPVTTRPPSNHTRRRLGFLGRLHRIKGLDRLLDAWALIAARHPLWEMAIRGPDGGEASAIRARAANLPRVQVGPAVSDEQKSDWYGSCDLLVLPSYAENFGMVVAESLAHAIPVIASTGSPWRMLPSMGCGWWVSNDTETLARTLEFAMALPASDLARMGESGRKWMAADFSWPPVAARLVAAYRWIAGAGPRPHGII